MMAVYSLDYILLKLMLKKHDCSPIVLEVKSLYNIFLMQTLQDFKAEEHLNKRGLKVMITIPGMAAVFS